jgi:GTP-binding protein HflX
MECNPPGRRGVSKAILLTTEVMVAETEELSRSAGLELVAEVLQRRRHDDPVTYLGRGKVADVELLLKEVEVDTVLVNGELKPSQHYQLEKRLQKEVLDRIGLVLRIFTERASSREARLQVERAKLQYEMPLLREWIHNAKGGERPGFLAGGEYAVDIYYELSRKRMARIDHELRAIAENHETRRRRRTKEGYFTVSLAGYTNAGKSSIMRRLTDEEVLVEDRVFSTLSTTTRVVSPGERPILLTDTIGFISDLPPFLIESFRATIEEIFLSDLILLVLDASEERKEMEKKLRTSMEILFPSVEEDDVIVVLNKTDKDRKNVLDASLLTSLLIPSATQVAVSAITGEGIDRLMGVIRERFQPPIPMELDIPSSSEAMSFLSTLYDKCEVVHVEHGERIRISLRCAPKDRSRILAKTAELEAGR